MHFLYLLSKECGWVFAHINNDTNKSISYCLAILVIINLCKSLEIHLINSVNDKSLQTCSTVQELEQVAMLQFLYEKWKNISGKHQSKVGKLIRET